MLKKYISQGVDGIKKLTCYLENVSEDKREHLIVNSFIEDPVFTQLAVNAMLKIDDFLKLEKNDINLVIKNLINPIDILTNAFYKRGDNIQTLSEILPPRMFEDLIESLEISKGVTFGAREVSQLKILETVRVLEKRGMLRSVKWPTFPEKYCIDEKEIPKNGEFILHYENGEVAMAGLVQKKKRVGEWEFYTTEGNIYIQGNFMEGVKSGVWTFWHYNGGTKAQGKYVDDLREGVWREWDLEGNLLEVSYNAGKKS